MSAKHEPLAAACVLGAFPGHTAPDWLRRRIDRGLGGVVLFARNIRDAEQVAELTASLRGERDDVLIALDEEGGDVTRLEAAEGSSYPGNRALGVVDDPGLTERVAAALGGDLAEVGVNLDLAPVADVASDERSPIVGVRSFGSDPELVARHVAAFVHGLQRAGVAACAKHFPGHGGTALDSHLELPTVEKAYEQLAAEDLVPFRAAIQAGVRAIMTAHIRVPDLDFYPATISRRLLTGLLRERLGFDGLVITDALEMQAMSRTFGVEKSAVGALVAGADALCLGAEVGREDVDAVAKAIGEAVLEGRLAEDRLRTAGERVRTTARSSVGTGEREDRRIGLEAARRAVRVEGAVALTRPPFVLELRPEANIAAGPAQHGLGDVLRAAVVVQLEGPDKVHVPPDRQVVVVVRDAHRHAWQQAVVAALVEPVVVEIGVPVWRPSHAAGYVATHGGGRANLLAAAELLQQPST